MEKGNSNGGITFTGLLQVALIVLKLCHVIEWSWWLVFAPTLLGTLGIAIIVILLWIWTL